MLLRMLKDVKDANSILDAKVLSISISFNQLLNMSESKDAQSKGASKELRKICIHCKEGQRKPLASANFSRHLKDCHNERYNELQSDSRRRAMRPQFAVDFTWETDENGNTT